MTKHEISAMPTEYRPKGGMCAGCKSRQERCSALPFFQMPQIGREQVIGKQIITVKCTYFERAA